VPDPSRRRFLRRAAALAVGAAAATVTGGGVLGSYRFRVETIEARLEGLRDPLRAAWMCDLHYGPFIGVGSVAAWVDATLELSPDVVLLGGDLVDVFGRGDPAPLIEQLARLRAPLGVWGVWGNHDHNRLRRTRGGSAAFEGALAAAGITMLVNRGVRVRDDLYLAGLDDWREGRPDLSATLAARPAGVPCLLLSHNPDVLPLVPGDVELTLCGHTHGGQVRLPFVGPLVTSSRYGRRFASGWVRGPARGYVSRGLGVSQLPVRVACPAELTDLTLLPA
jgi:uncharacterized protein